ncbi:MAG: magnesium transporter [Spirochaetota bacterium]
MAELDEPILNYTKQDYVSLPHDATISRALAGLRTKKLPGKIVYFYVLDAHKRLTGIVSTRSLLTSKPDARVRDIIEPSIISLPHTASVSDACEFFIMYRFLAFPVIDSHGRMLGVVDVNLFSDEIFELTDREARENVFQLIGVTADERRHRNIFRSFTARFPWLISTIAGGVICAVIANAYHATLSAYLIIALFLPLVLALAESIGIQSMTLALAGLRKKKSFGETAFTVARETMTAFTVGIASALVVAVFLFLWKHDAAASVVMLASITLAMLTAAAFGAVVPRLVHAFGKDPSIAAGPLTLALGDVMALLYYFTIARAIFSLG